jgi:predicted transcriptional regulator
LFTRITVHEVARHPKRAALVEMIAAEPGIRFRELARTSRLPNGTLVHHLRKLEAVGLVKAIRSNRYLAYVVPGAARPNDRHPALQSEGAQRLANAIVDKPGIRVKDAAAIASLSPATAAYHLRRLVDARLVVAERDGRSIRLSPGI